MGTFILAFFIFQPFLYALVLAVVFAIVLQPIYQKIVRLTNGRQEISALMTVIFVIVFIFTPLIFLGVQIFQEAQQAYASLAGNGGIKTILNVLMVYWVIFKIIFQWHKISLQQLINILMMG
jgi:predicted PurR-regulated permease PerM